MRPEMLFWAACPEPLASRMDEGAVLLVDPTAGRPATGGKAGLRRPAPEERQPGDLVGGDE